MQFHEGEFPFPVPFMETMNRDLFLERRVGDCPLGQPQYDPPLTDEERIEMSFRIVKYGREKVKEYPSLADYCYSAFHVRTIDYTPGSHGCVRLHLLRGSNLLAQMTLRGAGNLVLMSPTCKIDWMADDMMFSHVGSIPTLGILPGLSDWDMVMLYHNNHYDSGFAWRNTDRGTVEVMQNFRGDQYGVILRFC